MNTEKHSSTQTLSLTDRKSLDLNGVNDVIRFDEEGVVLSTVCGTLTVEGTSLHVRVLNLEEGKVEIDGKVDALLYFDATEDGGSKRGLFSKLFH